MQRSLVVAGTVVGLAFAFGVLTLMLAGPSTDRMAAPTIDEPELYRLDGYESGVFPYINHRTEFEAFSSLNVIVRGTTEDVLLALTEQSDTEWAITPPNMTDAAPDTFSAHEVNLTGTEIAWGQTRGADRFAYVHDGDVGEWVGETEQLHYGTFYGERLHLRLFESPHEDEPWVAIQAHTEHMDWFTLRHAVDGNEEAQHAVEADFMGQPWVESVHREYLGNEGNADTDGWATIVELLLIVPVATVGSAWMTRAWNRIDPAHRRRLKHARERITLDHVLLAATIAAFVFGVRAGAILLELHAPFLHIYAIGAIGYPLLVLGMPLATYGIAHQMKSRMEAGVVASCALGASMILDYAALGVSVLPLDIVLHRVGLVLALGLVAAGAALRATRERHLNGLVVAGTALWIGLVVMALTRIV